MIEKREKIAEAMGWTYDINELWRPPNARWSAPLPDPFTNANDTDILIEWLIDMRGITVVVMHGVRDEQGRHRVNFAYSGLDDAVMLGKDWRHMVCDLAISVLDRQES